MTTLTVTIADDKDLSVLQEILKRFGLSYSVDKDKEFQFSKSEIDGFLKTKEDFLSGKKATDNPMLPGAPLSDKELNSLLDEAEADGSYTITEVEAKLNDKLGKTWMSDLGKEHI